MTSFAGLDPAQVRIAAGRLDVAAARLDERESVARAALGLSELTDAHLVRRIRERSELLVAVAGELRTRADDIEQVRLGIGGHAAHLMAHDLSTSGLESFNTIAEFGAAIAGWNGTDNDPLLDRLVGERADALAAHEAAQEIELDAATLEVLVAISLQLGVTTAEADRILTEEIAFPRQLEIEPGYYTGIGEQIEESGKLTAEQIVEALLAGEVFLETRRSVTQEIEYLEPSSLGPMGLAVYLALLAAEERQFRILTGDSVSEERYVNAISGHNMAQMDRLRFEQDVFGVQHFADPGSLHDLLNLIGWLPVVGEPADALNASIYLLEGDELNAALSGAAVIPFGGILKVGGKAVGRGRKVADALGGKLERSFRTADGGVVHRVRMPDGRILNVVELVDGRLVRHANVSAGVDQAFDVLGNVAEDQILSFPTRTLQRKFKHAVDFGVTGRNFNRANGEAFEQALREHVNGDAVRRISGTYRGNDVVHYVDLTTGLNAIFKPDGIFVSGWYLNPDQFSYVVLNGTL